MLSYVLLIKQRGKTVTRRYPHINRKIMSIAIVNLEENTASFDYPKTLEKALKKSLKS